MYYNYFCEEKKCTIADYMNSPADGFTLFAKRDYKSLGKELLVWEVSHPMAEKPDVRCPVCEGKAVQHYGFYSFTCIFRGNWALDRAGCQREMDLHKLEGGSNQYEEWYQPGEKDAIRSKILKAGRRAMKSKILNNIPKKITESTKRINKKATTIKLG